MREREKMKKEGKERMCVTTGKFECAKVRMF